MQGQQPVIRQSDQQTILQQPTSIVIKMNESIQPMTTVGMYSCKNLLFLTKYLQIWCLYCSFKDRCFDST